MASRSCSDSERGNARYKASSGRRRGQAASWRKIFTRCLFHVLNYLSVSVFTRGSDCRWRYPGKYMLWRHITPLGYSTFN